MTKGETMGEHRPRIVETVRFGWIVVGCCCTCDPFTGEWWSICSEHGSL